MIRFNIGHVSLYLTDGFYFNMYINEFKIITLVKLYFIVRMDNKGEKKKKKRKVT